MTKRANRYTFCTKAEEKRIDAWYEWIDKMREKHGNEVIDKHFEKIYDVSCGGEDLKTSKQKAKSLGLSTYGTG